MTGDEGRPALGDLTNRPVKRGFSFVLDDVGLKTRENLGKTSVVGDGDSQFATHVCLGVENLFREKSVDKISVGGIENSLSSMEKRSFGRNIAPGLPSEANMLNISKEDSNQGGDAKMEDVFTAEDASRKSCYVPTVSGSAGGPENRVQLELENLVRRMFAATSTEVGRPSVSDGRLNLNYGDKRPQIHDIVHVDDLSRDSCEDNRERNLVCQVARQGDKEHSMGKLASSKSGSVEWSRLPTSLGSKNLDLERCKFLKVSSDASHNANEPDNPIDPLKGCSCSFCLKAAYIWSDLHYQDIKGRIAALKKSQKEAASLVQKTGKAKDFVQEVCGSSSEPSQLETDLMNQWRSLFLHMEGVLVNESSQLQANYMALKDMRDNCKMDLETLNKKPEDRG